VYQWFGDILQVKGILVMYGLPWLLTGAILAHEVMHAWVAENNINCGHAEGDEMSAVGEGIAELLGFMWLEAQVLCTQISKSGRICLKTGITSCMTCSCLCLQGQVLCHASQLCRMSTVKHLVS